MNDTWTELLDAYLHLLHDTLAQIRREWDGLQLAYLDDTASARFQDKFRRWRERSPWPFDRLPTVSVVSEGDGRVVVELDRPRARLALERERGGWRLAQAYSPASGHRSDGMKGWRGTFEAYRERLRSYRSSPGKTAAIHAASLFGKARSAFHRSSTELPACRDALHGYLRLWQRHFPRLARRWHDAHADFLDRHAAPELVRSYRAFWSEVERMMPRPTFPTPRLVRRSRRRATVSLSNFMAMQGIPGRPTLPLRLEVSFVDRDGRWLIDDADLPRPAARAS